MSIDDFYRNRQQRPQTQTAPAPTKTTTITPVAQPTKQGMDAFFAPAKTAPVNQPKITNTNTATKIAPTTPQPKKPGGFTRFISDVIVNKNPVKLLAGTKLFQQMASSGVGALDYVFNRFIPAALVITGQEAVSPFLPKAVGDFNPQQERKTQRQQFLKNITPTTQTNKQGIVSLTPKTGADIQFGQQTWQQTAGLPMPVRYTIQAAVGLGFEGIKAFLPVQKITKVLNPLTKPQLVTVAERDLGALETGLLTKTAGKLTKAEAKPQYFSFENSPPNTLVKVEPVANQGIKASLVEVRPSRLSQATDNVKKLFTKGGAIKGQATETVIHSEIIPMADLPKPGVVPVGGVAKAAQTAEAAQALVARQSLPSMISKYREIVNNPQVSEQAHQLSQNIAQAQDVVHTYEQKNAQTIIDHRVTGSTEPTLKIDTVQYADGHHGVQVAANSGAESMSVPFSEIYPSQHAAIEAGIAKTQQFIRNQPAGTTTELQTTLNDVVDSLRGQEKIINRGLQYNPKSKRISQLFDQGINQSTIAQRGDTTFQIGDFGRQHHTRKVDELKGDRFPESELADTIKHITKSFRASNNRGAYRYDNIAWVAKMPSGEQRVIYTRLNKNGHEEIISWHQINATKNSNYLTTLESFGSPDRIRTGITRLEHGSPNPLAHGAKSNLPKPPVEVKPFNPNIVEIAKRPNLDTIKATAKSMMEKTLNQRIGELEKICP